MTAKTERKEGEREREGGKVGEEGERRRERAGVKEVGRWLS